MRIRQGNDFIFLWAIERNGEPENFSNAVNIRLHFKNYDCVGEVKSFQIVDGNIVRVEVSPEWASRLGAYRLILSYEFENSSYSDGDRKCVVDVLAFNIVPKTSEADDVTEMAKTTDIMIGLQGLSAYEVWLKDNPESTKEDYYNWLQKPATDAVSLIEDKIETLDTAIQQESERVEAEDIRLSNEQSRVEAEGLRVSGEVTRNTAEGIRVGNESTRIENEGIRLLAEEGRVEAESTRVGNETLRISAELLREGAESDREDAEQLRQTNTSTAIQNANEATQNANSAAELANTKAGEANTAAQNADDARLAIQDDLALKANHGYDSAPKTLKAVDEAKVDKTSIVGETGQGETSVMHQKAVTDELGTKAAHGYTNSPKTLKQVDDSVSQLAGEVSQKQSIIVNYTHTRNKEVNIESIDFATGTITATGHGLAVNNIVLPINKGMGNFPFSALPNGINPLTGYFVINVTPNTFQLSSTYNGAPITISDKATKDYSKWHLERPEPVSITGLSLCKFTVEFEGKSSGGQGTGDYFYLYGGKDYGGAVAVWIKDAEHSKITSGLSTSIFKSMANGDIWSYNRLDVDVTGKRASILINGYRIYSLTDTTRGIIRHNNEVAVHSSVGEDVVTSFYQVGVFNGINIKVTKIL